VPADAQSKSTQSETLHRGEEVFSLLSTLADRILASGEIDGDTVVLGIANGGIAPGKLLQRLLVRQTGLPLSYGILETSFHRDDIGARPIPIVAHPTDVPVGTEGRNILLVDDVIASGRTIRAALNELFDQGRPRAVRLAVLLDRGGRMLPVQPDYLAERVEVAPEQLLKVHIDEENPSAHRIELVSR